MTQQPMGGPPFPSAIRPRAVPRRASSNCMIWGLAGCGMVMILVIILSVVAARTFGGKFKGLVNGITAAPQCKEKLIHVRTALQTYQHDHKGLSPAHLKDLIPDYLPDDSDLSYRGSSGGATVPIDYTPPGKDSPSDAVVAGFFTGSFEISTLQSQKIYVHLLKDGHIVQDQVARQEMF